MVYLSDVTGKLWNPCKGLNATNAHEALVNIYMIDTIAASYPDLMKNIYLKTNFVLA